MKKKEKKSIRKNGFRQMPGAIQKLKHRLDIHTLYMQLAEGRTPLIQRPIETHVLFPKFKARFEAFFDAVQNFF